MAGVRHCRGLVSEVLARSLWVVPVVTVALMMVPLIDAAGEEPPAGPGTGVGCEWGSCGVGAYDPGAAGTVQQSDTGSSRQAGSGTNASGTGDGSAAQVDPNACGWKPLPVTPIAGSVLWHGGDAASGYVEYSNCPADPAAGSAGNFRFVPNPAPGAAPVPPPPPTPEELAQRAYQQLPIPVPSMNFGPDSSRVAVKYWLYMWVTDPGTVTATAAAGAVSVTAVARLSSVTWTMGEPASAENLSSRSAPVTCKGPGVDPGPSVDTTAQPADGSCAYMFQVRSTPERTGGSGTWPVTATANWTITWAANTGQAGTLAAPPRVSTTQVRVGAWSTVLVADGASGPGG